MCLWPQQFICMHLQKAFYLRTCEVTGFCKAAISKTCERCLPCPLPNLHLVSCLTQKKILAPSLFKTCCEKIFSLMCTRPLPVLLIYLRGNDCTFSTVLQHSLWLCGKADLGPLGLPRMCSYCVASRILSAKLQL